MCERSFIMNKRITIENIKWSEGNLHLVAANEEQELEVGSLKGAARVLADSDRLAFIYILESSDEYVYVSISNQFWPELKKVMTDHLSVSLLINEHQINLEGIEEELQELITNIKGNSNYGDKMVNEVESIL
jgi:hypothetical protein